MILNKFPPLFYIFENSSGSGLHLGDGTTLSKIFQVIMGGISDEMGELDSYLEKKEGRLIFSGFIKMR